MTSKFDYLITTLFLEYFIDNAKAYYMDSSGTMHIVKYTHIDQIIEDYDLNDDIEETFESFFGEPLDYSNDHDNEWVRDWVNDWRKDNRILFLVQDIDRKVLYVRGHKNDPSEVQREKIIDFCIKFNCELKYDDMVFA